MTILRMRGIKHRELSNLPKLTETAKGRPRVQIQCPGLRILVLNHYVLLPLLKEHPPRAFQEVKPDFQQSSWQRASWALGDLNQEAHSVPHGLRIYLYTGLRSRVDSCMCYGSSCISFRYTSGCLGAYSDLNPRLMSPEFCVWDATLSSSSLTWKANILGWVFIVSILKSWLLTIFAEGPVSYNHVSSGPTLLFRSFASNPFCLYKLCPVKSS